MFVGFNVHPTYGGLSVLIGGTIAAAVPGPLSPGTRAIAYRVPLEVVKRNVSEVANLGDQLGCTGQVQQITRGEVLDDRAQDRIIGENVRNVRHVGCILNTFRLIVLA